MSSILTGKNVFRPKANVNQQARTKTRSTTVSQTSTSSTASNIASLTNDGVISTNKPRVGYNGTGFVNRPEGTNQLLRKPPAGVALDSSINNFKPTSLNGFSSQRPEILALFGFNPVYDDLESRVTTPTGEMLEIQASARRLQAENVIRLINELKANRTTASILSQIESRINEASRLAKSEVEFLVSVIEIISFLEKSFNIKLNGEEIRRRTAERRDRLSRTRQRDQRLSIDIEIDTPPRDMKEILVEDLRFTQQGVGRFTNTKVLAQILDDFRVILSSFSPKIFDLPNFSRDNDVDSIRLNKLDVIVNGASTGFDIKDIASKQTSDVVSGATRASFDRFQEGLITVKNFDDRIKLLYSILSKEMRVSTGLSIASVQDTLTQTFGLENKGDIFQGIFGSYGDDVLQPISSGQKSIASLLRFESENKTILPFEQIRLNQYLNSYVPGKDFYIDSILQGDERFNTDPVENFANAFSTRIDGLAYIIEGTLDVDVLNSRRRGLAARDMYYRVNAILRQFVERITPQYTRNTDRDEFMMPLFRLAANDPDVKYFMFLKFLATGFYEKLRVDTSAKSNATFYDYLESVGLTADVVIQEIFSQATQIFSRNITSQETLRTTLDRDEVKNAQQRLRDGTSLAKQEISVAMSAISDAIILLVLSKQTEFSELTYPTTVSGLSPTRQNAGSIEGFANPQDKRVRDDLARRAVRQYEGIFKELNSYLNELDSQARKGIVGTSASRNPQGYFDNTNPGLTKFSGLGAHTLPLIILEIATSTIARLNFATIAGIRTDRNPLVDFIIRIDDDATQIAEAVLDTQTKPTPIFGSAILETGLRERFIDLASQFNSINKSLDDNDKLIRTITDSLISVSKSIKESTEEVIRFFDLERGPNRDILSRLNSSNDARDKFATLDQAQVSLAKNALREQDTAREVASTVLSTGNDSTLSEDISPFVDDTVLLPGVKNAMYSMLAQPEFTAGRGNNVQILSLGLPAGFSSTLKTRTRTLVIGQDLAEFERRRAFQDDIIRVNVYMRDAIFDEIVFKPKTYLFEISRFVSNIDFKNVSDPTISFDRMLEEQIRTVSITQSGLNIVQNVGLEAPGSTISNDESYSFLSAAQKRQLIRNHVASYLLNTYIRILTGVNMTETSFPVNKIIAGKVFDNETKRQFEQLLTTHVSQFTNNPVTIQSLRRLDKGIDELLSRLDENEVTKGLSQEILVSFPGTPDSANIEISQDIVTFMKTFSRSSFLFGAGANRERITSPKLFERIFHIAIDPDEFEIDEVLTASTSAGQSVLSSRSFIGQQEPRRDQVIGGFDEANTLLSRQVDIRERVILARRSRHLAGQASLLQFFITIEQLPEFPELQAEANLPEIIRPPSGIAQSVAEIVSSQNANGGRRGELDETSYVSHTQQIRGKDTRAEGIYGIKTKADIMRKKPNQNPIGSEFIL